MADVNVKVKFDITKNIERFLDAATTEAIGSAVVEKAKDMISTGMSPVRGEGRFPSYLPPYPKNLKSSKPVNLYLSGEMMDAFKYKKSSNNSLTIGIMDGGSDVKARAQRHNSEYTRSDGQSILRKFIPQEGDEWAVSIMKLVKDIIEKRLSEVSK